MLKLTEHGEAEGRLAAGALTEKQSKYDLQRHSSRSSQSM